MNRKARKDHDCILCKGEIVKGTTYAHKRVTPWDHPDNEYFFDYKAHLDCDEFWMENNHIVDGVIPDDWKDFIDCVKAEKEWRKYRSELRKRLLQNKTLKE